MKKINNFADLGKSLGIRNKRKPAKSEEIRKCRKCGAIMSKIENTNIYLCTTENCNNYAIKRIHGNHKNGFNGKFRAATQGN